MTESENILSILSSIPDPEIPVLTINDLGIIRNINIIQPGKSVEVVITPTYSGCPAMDTIAMNIRLQLLRNGYHYVILTHVARITGGTLKPGDDVRDARLVSPEELAALPTTDSLDAVVARGRALLRFPIAKPSSSG